MSMPSSAESNGRVPILEAKHLRKVYAGKGRRTHDRVAVADTSFVLYPGQSLGIVGESGSGKSTVAKILVGLERPTDGQLYFDGQLASRASKRSDRKERARKIQLVFQDPYSSLNPRQSIGAAIGEILDVHFNLGRAERADRVTELLDSVGLDPASAARFPRHLSGGQRQRVAIARALAAEPEVLVLDEAVAALDISVQAQVLNLLARLRRTTNISYLFISHDLAVVAHMTDTVQVMQRGVVVEKGSAIDVLSRPQHDYTKQLIDSIPRPGWVPMPAAPAPA